MATYFGIPLSYQAELFMFSDILSTHINSLNPLGAFSEWGSVGVGVSQSFLMDFDKFLIKTLM